MNDGVVGVQGHVKLTGLRLNSVDVSNSDDAQEAVTNLNNSAENLQAAESRIRDLDMAEEMMAFTKNNILQQAATAMLAQANQQPQSVLQLLR
jgi:flagellin